MAEPGNSEEEVSTSETEPLPHAPIRTVPPTTTRYFSTARTAPRAAHESRIGTDEAHARLQAARNEARRNQAGMPEGGAAEP
jgi:hypothetical protein